MTEVSHEKEETNKAGTKWGKAREVPKTQNLNRLSVSGLCKTTWAFWKYERWDAEAALRRNLFNLL